MLGRFRLPAYVADVRRYDGPVPQLQEPATHRSALWAANNLEFRLELSDSFRAYCTQDGLYVTADSSTWAESVLRTTPFAALLFLRGLFAAHASVVARHDRGVLLAGDSGMGKSTLAVELLNRGWTLVSDEVSALDLDGHGGVIARPTFADLELWPKGAGGRHSAASVSSEPVRITDIYRLGIRNRVEALPIQGHERFRFADGLIYNRRLASALMPARERFRFAQALSTPEISIRRLWRPSRENTVSELADLVETGR